MIFCNTDYRAFLKHPPSQSLSCHAQSLAVRLRNKENRQREGRSGGSTQTPLTSGHPSSPGTRWETQQEKHPSSPLSPTFQISRPPFVTSLQILLPWTSSEYNEWGRAASSLLWVCLEYQRWGQHGSCLQCVYGWPPGGCAPGSQVRCHGKLRGLHGSWVAVTLG